MRTKNEIKACIDELKRIIEEVELSDKQFLFFQRKILELTDEYKQASSDLVSSVLESHTSMCEAMGMGEHEAFGNDPATYYGLALSGECGELANKLIKVLRVRGTQEQKQRAIRSELPDVLIYSVILAYTNGLDATEIVNEKVDIVVKRANDGYYNRLDDKALE